MLRTLSSNVQRLADTRNIRRNDLRAAGTSAEIASVARRCALLNHDCATLSRQWQRVRVSSASDIANRGTERQSNRIDVQAEEELGMCRGLYRGPLAENGSNR
jgi:hypothetical protein